MTTGDHSKEQLPSSLQQKDLPVVNGISLHPLERHVGVSSAHMNSKGSISKDDRSQQATVRDDDDDDNDDDDDSYKKFAYNYEITDDQRKALIELHNLKLDLGYTENEPESDYNVSERVRRLNEDLAMEPMVSDRETKIKFKENVVDFITPTPDISAYDVEEDDNIEDDNQTLTSNDDKTSLVEPSQKFVSDDTREVLNPHGDIKAVYIETPRGVIESSRRSSSSMSSVTSPYASGDESKGSDSREFISILDQYSNQKRNVANNPINAVRETKNVRDRHESGDGSMNRTDDLSSDDSSNDDENNNISPRKRNEKDPTSQDASNNSYSASKAPDLHENIRQSPKDSRRTVNDEIHNKESRIGNVKHIENEVHDVKSSKSMKQNENYLSSPGEDLVIERNGEFHLQSEYVQSDNSTKNNTADDKLDSSDSKKHYPAGLKSANEIPSSARKTSQINSSSVKAATKQPRQVGLSPRMSNRTRGSHQRSKSPPERANTAREQRSLSRQRHKNMQITQSDSLQNVSIREDAYRTTPRVKKTIVIPEGWLEQKENEAKRKRKEELAKKEEQKKKEENMKFKEWKLKNLDLQWQRMEQERKQIAERHWKKLLDESFQQSPRPSARANPDQIRSQSTESALREKSTTGKNSQKPASRSRNNSTSMERNGGQYQNKKKNRKEEEDAERLRSIMKKRQSEAAAERKRIEEKSKMGPLLSARQNSASGEWMSAEEWKRKKAEQLREENMIQFAEAKYLREGTTLYQPEDYENAFNIWLKKKRQEAKRKKEAERQKVNIARLVARRTRKSLALASAVNQARSLYTDYYGYRY